jgi:hypothetical protein
MLTRFSQTRSRPLGKQPGWAVFLILAALLAWTGIAGAAIPTSTQFDITGFLQEATQTAGALGGGTLKVNGQVVTVPANTIVILPANALTWTELFTQAPAPYTNNATGMALFDVPPPLTTYEVHVVGNRVTTAVGGDQYIAGLIDISQLGLNSGAGYINFIDYAKGEMRVGGLLNDPTTGARLRINDPVGRYGRINSPDPRFTVDPDNPTIMAGTGYPMCLPRVTPPAPGGAETDLLCPQRNRPLDQAGNFLISIDMPNPATLAAGQLPDPRIQAPFEIGDYITYAGTLVTDNANPTQGPWPGIANTYISAHTIVNNTAIYTSPGTNPAYVMTEVTIIGTGGLTVIGLGEAAVRTRFEGMTTDPSRNIHLYGIDMNPLTGTTTDRSWGTIGVDPGPAGGAGAVRGRWRFRPPCDPFGTVPAKPDKTCVMNAAGDFLPPTREVRAVIEGAWVPGQTTTYANGIIAGQYHAPILEYIFPENVPGTPIVPNNFEELQFLACGGYTSSAGTLANHQLNPWPGAVAPTCAGQSTAPVANAGPDQTVASGAHVTLAGSATGSPTPTFAWVQTGGTPVVVLTNPTNANPTFTAPTGPAVLTFQLTATNSAGSSTDSVIITVNAAAAPTVIPIAPRTVGSGTPVSITASCTSGSCTFVWTQTSGIPTVLVPNPKTGATQSFTVSLPAGAPTSVLVFSIVATNAANVSSAPATTTVTVIPPADTVTITNAEFRTGKQRVILTASSSLVDPNVILTLQPYLTTTGTIFDPAGIGNTFTNTGGGLYTITVVGAPEPAVPPATPLTVKSSAGGVSPPHGLDRIRQ